jgi:hypothetical protein
MRDGDKIYLGKQKRPDKNPALEIPISNEKPIRKAKGRSAFASIL